MSVKITIEFPNSAQRDAFLGQVSDGAMENMCDLKPLNPKEDDNGKPMWDKPFGGATQFRIKMLPREEWF